MQVRYVEWKVKSIFVIICVTWLCVWMISLQAILWKTVRNQNGSGDQRQLTKIHRKSAEWKAETKFFVTSSLGWMIPCGPSNRKSAATNEIWPPKVCKNHHNCDMLRNNPWLHSLSHMCEFGWFHGAYSIGDRPQSNCIWPPTACKKWSKRNMLQRMPAFSFQSHL